MGHSLLAVGDSPTPPSCSYVSASHDHPICVLCLCAYVLMYSKSWSCGLGHRVEQGDTGEKDKVSRRKTQEP